MQIKEVLNAMQRYVFPATSQRVEKHTKENINCKIDTYTNENINLYKNRGKAEISSRIKKLNHEWDIERVLETNAAIATFSTILLGLQTKKKKWFVLSGFISAFLLQHALQGWCPPLAIFRRIGIRTSSEIDEEKFYLKYFRGDFKE
jgi:hypothetical protein